MSELERRKLLVDKWLIHAEEAGHNLETARHDGNLACTYIMCCVKGCKWAHSLALEKMTKGES